MLEFATPWRRFIPWIIGGLGIFLIVGGAAWEYYNSYLKTSQANSTISTDMGQREVPISTNKVSSVNTVKTSRLIKIDIEGSIEKPGIVEIPYDSRIQDVLIAAGGLTTKADRTYVSKNINLAQRVNDGMKIYIPAIGEVASATGGISTNPDASILVNINSAAPSELVRLPGVGPVTANKIISSRPYQEISELVSKKVVNRSVFEKIKSRITAN